MSPRRSRIVAAGLLVIGAWARGGDAPLSRDIQGLRENSHEAKARLIKAGPIAVRPLAALLADADPRVAWAARSALRWIAVRAAEPTAPAARREKTLAAVLPLLDAKEPAAVRRTALEVLALVGTDEQAKAIAPLLADEALGEAAAEALGELWGHQAKAALIEALKSAKPGPKARILALLASHREANTLPLFVAAATDDDEDVRVAAIKAIGLLAQAEGLPALTTAIQKGSARTKAAAFDSLLATAAERVRTRRRPAARALYEQAIELAADDTQLAAALAGIGRVGDPTSLSMIQARLKAKAGLVRSAAYAALCQMRGPAGTQAITAALGDAPREVKPLLIRALGGRRDRGGAPILLAAARDANELVALAAIDALEQLADPSVCPALLELARAGLTKAVQAAALRLSIRFGHRLADAGQGPQAVAILEGALEAATDDRDRAETLHGMGKTGEPRAVAKLLPVASDTASPLRLNAADALVAIGDAAAARGDREAAVTTYKQTMDLEPSDSLVAELGRKLQDLGVHYNLATKKGFVTTWWLIGPFPLRNFKGAKKPRFPEHELELKKAYKIQKREVRWKLHHSSHPKGWVDLNALFSPNDKVLAYGLAEVAAPKAMDVKLWFRRDDGLTVWLNAAPVYDVHGPHSAATEEFSADAKLRKGINYILIKSSEGSNSWEFAVRITDRDGKPLKTQK